MNATQDRVTSGLIAINIAAILFGTAALFGKLNVSSFWIVAMRGAFACLALFLFGLIRGGLVPVQRGGSLESLVFTGLLLSIHWLTFFASVKFSGIAIATLTFAAFPLFTVLLTAFTLRTFPKPLQIVAGLAIIIAVLLLVDIGSSTSSTALGILAGLTSAISFAYFGIKSKRLTLGVPPLTVSLVQNLTVALSILPILPFVSPAPRLGTDWLWLLLLGVVSTAFMHQLYLFALARLSPTVCSGFVALEPVYAVTFAALIFQEPITILVLLSGALIVGASMVLLAADRDTVSTKSAEAFNQ